MGRNIRCIRCSKSKSKRLFTYLPGTTNAETKPYAKGNVCHDCQRAAPPKTRKQEMKPYVQRDFVLRSMGFPTYAAYLASPLWAGIRQRVLRLRNYRCEMCDNRAELVHHNLYRREELIGQSLRGMKALCHACHEQVEFRAGQKVGVVEASHRFYSHA